jgi:gamma-glutamyltranspeptidase / glutathione hydrolase
MQDGTLSFSACEKHGNIAALTHGDGFGAHVSMHDLGLTLGHGMSRFDPRPDHPIRPERANACCLSQGQP